MSVYVRDFASVRLRRDNEKIKQNQRIPINICQQTQIEQT